MACRFDVGASPPPRRARPARPNPQRPALVAVNLISGRIYSSSAVAHARQRSSGNGNSVRREAAGWATLNGGVSAVGFMRDAKGRQRQRLDFLILQMLVEGRNRSS